MERKITVINEPPQLGGVFNDVNWFQPHFDSSIYQKGYHVYWDNIVMCPCKKEGVNSHESTCRNCGGKGFVVAERVKTKMLISSINLETKYREWSIEKTGTVRITAFSGLYLTYQDKITLIETLVGHNEVLYLKKTPDNLAFYSFTYYPIIELEKAYWFKNVDQKLEVIPISEFDIDEEKIICNHNFGLITNPVITLKYKYNPQYSILDNTREIIKAPIFDSNGREQNVDFPVSGVGRRMHLIYDQNNYAGNYLLDNTQ